MKSVICVVVALLFCAGSVFAFNTKGLVLYFTFDEGSGKVAKDASGKKNDGELQGGAKWVDGKYGKAVDIPDNAATDMVLVKDSDSLDITDEITMMAWANMKTFPDTYNAILGKNNTYMLHTDVQTNPKEARMDPLVWVGGAYGTWPSSAASPVPLGSWHHVAGVYDGKEIRTYVDGELTGKIAKNGGIDVTAGNLVIGRDIRGGCDTRRCAQIIDEVMIWSRALSEDEVNQIMQGGSKAFAVDASGKLATQWGQIKN